MKSYMLPSLHKSSSANNRRSHIIIQEKQSRPKSRQVKVSYIARKISQDDVCDSTMKQSSAMLLGQIKEEKTENIEELSEDQSDFELTFEGNKNIFHTVSVFASSKYKEPAKGPIYTEGQIVKHSIIGSVEGYEKAQQSAEKAQRIKALGTFDQDSNASTVDRKFSRAPSSVNSVDEGTANSRTGTATSFAMKKLMKGKAKDLKEVKIRKEDLMKKFDQLKENEHRFYQYDARRHSNLSYGDRLNQTKDARCLEKFDEASNIWDKNVIRMTQLCGKSTEHSVMLRSGHFREKVEIANVLEANKTMHERFGSRLWPITLRRDVPNVTKRNNSMIENMSLGFSMIDPVEAKTPLELIRTPLRGLGSSSSIESTKDFSQTKLLDRTSEEYLNTKISKLGRLLSSMSPSNVTQAGSLMIEGRNKLDLEVNTFMRKYQDKDVINIPKDFLQPKNVQDIEEVFEEHHDKPKMMRNAVPQ